MHFRTKTNPVSKLGWIDRVISYASRALSKTEHKYLAHKVECLALKWLIMDQFQGYLYGNTFVIYMQNNLLTHVLPSMKLDATGHHLGC